MQRLSTRRGVTLLEIAIVIAIIGVMAALAGTLLTQNLPGWRTRRAAREFSANVMMARQLAMAQDVEYRVRLGVFDTDLTDGIGTGVYYIEKGNRTSSSTEWDILPWDMDGSGAQFSEGTVDISQGGEDMLRGVSIADWGTISGIAGNDLVFSPQGWLVNPVSDFNSLGYLEIRFVNEPARVRGAVDDWVVQVSRGGMVRMVSSRQTDIVAANGTPDASQWTSSSGSGYNP